VANTHVAALIENCVDALVDADDALSTINRCRVDRLRENSWCRSWLLLLLVLYSIVSFYQMIIK